MSREAHVQFCESLGVGFLGATHRNIYVRSKRATERLMQAVTSWLERRLKLKVKCVQEHSGETVGVEVPWLRHDVAQEAEAEDSATKPPAYRRENPQDAGVGTWQKLETSHRTARRVV